MVGGQVASCSNHPGREAAGVCVACRTRICSECVTRVDGIGYCVSCLSSLAAEGAPEPIAAPKAVSKVFGGLALGTFFTTLVLVAWALTEVVMRG